MFENLWAKWSFAALSTGAIIGTILGWLPYIAAFAAFVWYVIQIWESRTIQHWWANRQMLRRARKIAQLKAHEKIIAAQLLALQTVRAARKEAKEIVTEAAVEATRLQAQVEQELLQKPSLNSTPDGP